jgi:hypothetical protein
LLRIGPDVEWRRGKTALIDPNRRQVVNAVDKKLTGRIPVPDIARASFGEKS